MAINTSLSANFLAMELIVLVLIVVICLLIYVLRKNTMLLQQLVKKVDSDPSEQQQAEFFNSEQAEKWFEKGEITQLTQYCERFIKETPNSVHANWYCGLGHYNQGDYELARDYFEKVIRINPLWREGAAVYLQEIADKIGLPPSSSIH
ncbi:MAG: hypothetical protein CR975_07115 [Gammaproteobacteria bacterium]|nr:MAG: hypothetical protein CR975_07115 [Gammaproteobacteria bacterium]